MKHHALMRYLLVAGGALVVGLLVAGTSWQSALPLIMVLACPLMMIFMMRGMGGHGGSDSGPHNHDADLPHPATRDGDRGHSDSARRL